MVEPRASNGQQKNILIFVAAVIAATDIEPSPLTATCSTILPIAVIEYCNPIGIPIPHRIFMIFPFGAASSFVIRNTSYRFAMNIRQAMPETA